MPHSARDGHSAAMHTALLDALEGRLAPGAILHPDCEDARYRSDATRLAGAQPSLILRPRSTAEVSEILAACNLLRQCIVIQGGRTGLAGGACPLDGEVALSLERMTTLEPVDPLSSTLLAEAGVPLQTVQEAAANAGLFFGVDIGARGTATVGGNVATNAGGIRVLRYGMFRAQVRGLEAVLADGTIVSSLRGLAKDNAGYDLKQIFVGSEGTLGVVTRARLALWPATDFERVAFCAAPSLAKAQALLVHLRRRLGARLSAFEAIWGPLYDQMAPLFGVGPLATGEPLYIIVETQDQGDSGRVDPLEAAMLAAHESSLCGDVILSNSMSEMHRIWRLRENCSEFIRTLKHAAGHDVSLPDSMLGAFIDAAQARVRAVDASAEIFIFGHLGDGNVHYIVDSAARVDISRAVYETAAAMGGSISAEHGIGLAKKPYLTLTRSAAEMALMRRLKHALDPHGILNSGRIFDRRPGDRCE